MKRIENDCVGCTDLGMHCMGSACPKREAVHYYCDECGSEEELYVFEDKELCLDCILERLEKVE